MAETPAQKTGRKLQVGIRTIVLLVALIAVWIGLFINREENQRLESWIKTNEWRVRELNVDDRSQIAVVKQVIMGSNALGHLGVPTPFVNQEVLDRWEIHLPAEYRACLATRGIAEGGTAKTVHSATVAAGRHHLALNKVLDNNVWRVTLACDRKALLSVREPKEWDQASASVEGAEYSKSTQLPTDQPAFLVRRRFFQAVVGKEPVALEETRMTKAFTFPEGPVAGILLWLERAGNPR